MQDEGFGRYDMSDATRRKLGDTIVQCLAHVTSGSPGCHTTESSDAVRPVPWSTPINGAFLGMVMLIDMLHVTRGRESAAMVPVLLKAGVGVACPHLAVLSHCSAHNFKAGCFRTPPPP